MDTHDLPGIVPLIGIVSLLGLVADVDRFRSEEAARSSRVPSLCPVEGSTGFEGLRRVLTIRERLGNGTPQELAGVLLRLRLGTRTQSPLGDSFR